MKGSEVNSLSGIGSREQGLRFVFSELFHCIYKIFFRDNGFIPGAKPVVINRLCGTMEEVRYLHAVCDAESYQGMYAQFGIKQFAFFQFDALFG